MLKIPNMTKKELFFNFMDNLQGWDEQELRCQGVQDLATAMAVAESLMDYKKRDSSKIDSLEDSDYYQKVLFCRPNYNGFKHL